MTKRVESQSPVANELEFIFFGFRVNFNCVIYAEFSIHTHELFCRVLNEAWNTETLSLTEVSI
jgi:hypothetical protein